MKKLFCTILLMLLGLLCLVGCGTEGERGPNQTEETETEAEGGKEISLAAPYTVIYSHGDFRSQHLAEQLCHAIKQKTGISLSCRDDTATESACEILMGDTNRAESAQAQDQMGESRFIITVINEKLVILAKDIDLYEVVEISLINAISKDGSASLPNSLCLLEDTRQTQRLDVRVKPNEALAFELVLQHKSSTAELSIATDSTTGGQYFLRITPSRIALCRRDEVDTEIVGSEVRLIDGKTYGVYCHFDGARLCIYLDDPAREHEQKAMLVGTFANGAESVLAGEVCSLYATVENVKQGSLDIPCENKTYQNNLIFNAADPDILYYEGYYYIYVTADHYPVYRSADLGKWEYVCDALPEVSWDVDKRYMWAPDVEYVNGKFYMAVTMGEAGLGMAVSDSPTGPFVCVGDQPYLTKTIDGHIFVDEDGRIYLYYTSWSNGRTYGIWGVELETDCITPKWETERLILTPTEPWECTDNSRVVEAPFMLKKEGVYYLIYSGSGYTADYAVGFATSTDPLSGFVKSASNPILRGNGTVMGTGHCSIAVTPSGKMVMAYHVHHSPTAVHPRHVAIDPVRFVKTDDGYILVVDGPTTSKQLLDVFR